MKKQIVAFCALCIPAFLNAQTIEFDEGLRFDEGTVSYKNMILVSNFGSEQCDPLNDQGKGYIMAVSGGAIKEFIASDGSLSAPKGMTVLGNHLFVADVGRVVVYDLHKLGTKPLVITLPEGELFVNDLVSVADIVLVTVTNTGNIYGIDVNNIASTPKLLGNVPGANGIAISGSKVYVASYNPTEIPSTENVIYVTDIVEGAKEFRPLIEGLSIGQYDGIACSEDGSTLYFTSWSGENGGEIFSYDLIKGGAVKKLNLGVQLTGPADITVKEKFLFVPDLPNSKLYRFKL